MILSNVEKNENLNDFICESQLHSHRNPRLFQIACTAIKEKNWKKRIPQLAAIGSGLKLEGKFLISSRDVHSE